MSVTVEIHFRDNEHKSSFDIDQGSLESITKKYAKFLSNPNGVLVQKYHTSKLTQLIPRESVSFINITANN